LFKIYDGRDKFYQWDIDRKLIIEDSSVTEVHFCNRTDSCSLVCQVYEEDGLTLVNVPNILLQTDWRINVYAYDKNYTKHSGVFEVVKRTKPTDYVYTETEIITWETIEAKIDAIYNDIDGVVTEYLDENPIQVDLSDYYTKAETDDAIEQAVAAIPEPDLSDYAKKSEIPSTSGLATEKYVDDAIADIDIPSTAGLATEKYVQEQIKKIDIPDTDLSNYYNKQEVDAKIPDTSGFALKSEIPDTSKFITEVPAEYVTETELGEAIAAIDIPETDLSGYYTKDEIDDMLANLPAGDIPSGEGVEF
jgi:hypothetical protein